MLIEKHCSNCGSDFFIGNNQTPTIYIGDKDNSSPYIICPYCDVEKIKLSTKEIFKLQK